MIMPYIGRLILINLIAVMLGVGITNIVSAANMFGNA